MPDTGTGLTSLCGDSQLVDRLLMSEISLVSRRLEKVIMFEEISPCPKGIKMTDETVE